MNFRVQKNTRTQKGSDFAEVAYYVLKNRCNEDVTMSIWEINKILDEIAVENGKGKEGQKVRDSPRVSILLSFFNLDYRSSFNLSSSSFKCIGIKMVNSNSSQRSSNILKRKFHSGMFSSRCKRSL